DLAFPFRRYQMQRVYRGERAQRGRFREFYQCDIDVVGKDTLSPRFDAEIPAVIAAVFERLAIGDFTVQLNHRKLLRGYFEGLGIQGDAQFTVLRELDKLDKRGIDAVRETLAGEGFGLAQAVIDQLMAFAGVRSQGHDDALAKLEALGSGTPLFEEGRAELRTVLQQLRALGVDESRYALNLSIARGLDYYTGTVYETFLDDHPRLGSICSGGRYENLAGHYTKSKLPGVGISIGATRLFSQLLEMKLIDDATAAISQVLVLQVEAALAATYAELATELRVAGYNVEVYGADDKLGKQFKYADRSKVPLALLCGSREAEAGLVKLKDLRTGTEHEVPRGELVARVRELLGR
nr:histidine--tRNA ligase [Deltaproteobacteria bacterium]